MLSTPNYFLNRNMGRMCASAILQLLLLGTNALASPSGQALPHTASTQATGSASVTNHLLKGKQYGQNGDWVNAEKELRIYKNANPESEEAVVLHSEALVELNQPFDAALELQSFLAHHPDSVRALKLHATLASHTLLDESVAQSELVQVTKLSPTDVQAWRNLAELYMDEGKMDAAVGPLTEANKLRPNDPVILASLAYTTGQSNPSANVEGMFAKALKLAENSPKTTALVQMLYGRHLFESDHAAASISSFTKVLTINPDYSPGLYWRARAYEQSKNLPAAEADALKALKFSPRDNQSALLLVSIYRKQGNLPKAQQYADLVQKLAQDTEKQNANGRALRESLDHAEHYLDSGQFAQATPEYESIIQRLPTFYEAYFDLGICYVQTGRFADAETAFRKYLSFQPLSPDGHAALGILLLQMGRGKQAVPELEQAVQLDPDNVEARKVLANQYLHDSNPKAAIALLQSQSAVKDKDIQLLTAEAYRQAGQFSAALKAADRALAIAPGDPQSLQLKEKILAQQHESGAKPHSQLWAPLAIPAS